MKHQEISEKYKKWIIEFYSERFDNPIFFIWLTDTSDEKEQDQFLLIKSDKILAAKSKRKLIKSITSSRLILPDSKQTNKWMKQSLGCKKISSTKCDLRKIGDKIRAKKLNCKDLESIINFINLYEDYKYQTGKQKARTKKLNKVWNYYYEEIFYPNFDRTTHEKSAPFKLKINYKKLLNEYCEILEEFESKVEIR